jgi:hypothetical protein
MESSIESLIEELERDPLLNEPDQLRQRIEALDRLAAFLEDGESAQHFEPWIYDQAKAVYAKVDAANSEFYESIRREIQRGTGREVLLQYLCESASERGVDGLAHGDGYDYLDDLISGVLRLEMPVAQVALLEAEMVPYQPTPARPIFDMIRRTGLNEQDVLMDLGSGLGHVPLLTAICSNARAIGIEIEAAYVTCARQCAEALHLNNATFIQQDVRDADLSRGTLFYLYTPFTGTILRSVLESLRREAATREIRICTFGPCAPIVAEEGWLHGNGDVETDRISRFSSRM